MRFVPMLCHKFQPLVLENTPGDCGAKCSPKLTNILALLLRRLNLGDEFGGGLFEVLEARFTTKFHLAAFMCEGVGLTPGSAPSFSFETTQVLSG